jgi:hypothetical protein
MYHPFLQPDDGVYLRGRFVILASSSSRVLYGLVSGGFYTASKDNVGTPIAALQINRDGSITQSATDGTGAANVAFPPAWGRFIATALGDGFYVRCTPVSGFHGGSSPENTWLSLSSDRQWTVARGALGSNTESGTIEIAADSAGAQVLASFTFGLRASVVSP